MRVNRILLSTVLVAVALVVQVCILARLHLPGAVPDLLLLVVIALALVWGHVAGALIGFGAGLLTDLAPPADHAMGRYALVLCFIGYLAGLAKPDRGRAQSATVPLLVVCGAAVGSTFLSVGVAALVGETHDGQTGLGSLVLTALIYDLLLAPFTVPLIMTLARRIENDPLADASGTGTGADRPTASLVTSGGMRLKKGRIGSARTGLLTRPAKPRIRTARIKGVKRL